MARDKVLTPEDLEWEDPPRAGRAPGEELKALIETVKAMTPALRSKLDKWAVVEYWPEDEKKASNRANQLRKTFGTLDTIEARLVFRGARVLEGGSKLYVKLARAGDAL